MPGWTKLVWLMWERDAGRSSAHMAETLVQGSEIKEPGYDDDLRPTLTSQGLDDAWWQ